MDIGIKLLGVLNAKKISQKELAEMSGLTVQTISKFKSGLNVSLDTIRRITNALDLPLDYFENENATIVGEPEVKYNKRISLIDTVELERVIFDLQTKMDRLEQKYREIELTTKYN